MKVLAPIGACVLAVGLFIPAANADTVAFTGTGSQNSNSFRFNLTGSDFLYQVTTSQGPMVVATCTPNVPCEVQQNYAAGILAPSDLASNFITLGNLTVNSITGRILVAGMLIAPSAPGDFQATIPVSLSGQVVGHYTPVEGGTDHPQALNVVLGGVGSADLRGVVTESGSAVVSDASYTFSGSALPSAEVPEPGAIFLTAGGIGLLALLFRRRRRAVLE